MMKTQITLLCLLLAAFGGCVTAPHTLDAQGRDNPLIGVWDRLEIQGSDVPDQGQIFIVRSDGMAVLKGAAWRSHIPELPQPYSLDRGKQTITFKGATFRYSISRTRRLTLLTLELLTLAPDMADKTIKQTYCLMTNTL